MASKSNPISRAISRLDAAIVRVSSRTVVDRPQSSETSNLRQLHATRAKVAARAAATLRKVRR